MFVGAGSAGCWAGARSSGGDGTGIGVAPASEETLGDPDTSEVANGLSDGYAASAMPAGAICAAGVKSPLVDEES